MTRRPRPLPPFSRHSAFKKRGGLPNKNGGNGPRNNQESFVKNGLIFTTPTLTTLDVLSRLERPTYHDSFARMHMPLLGTVVEEILDKKNRSLTTSKRKTQRPGQKHQQQQTASDTTMSTSAVATTDHVAAKRTMAYARQRPEDADMVHAVNLQKPKRKRPQHQQQQRAKEAAFTSDKSGKLVKLQSEEKSPTSSSSSLTVTNVSVYRLSVEEKEVSSTKHQATAGPEIIEIDDSDDDGDQDDVVATTIKRRICMDDEDEVLFIYPFTKNLREMDSACVSLTELGDETCHGGRRDDDDGDDFSLSNNNTETAVACSSPTTTDDVIFRDSLRITVKDYRLLQPDQYWNDVLIDFWMRWISRNQINNDNNADVFFFTTQFYTELTSRSPEAMTRWIKRKGINIFQKKLLFLPIHADLHWTLAVIVNPGHILSMVATKENGGGDRTTPFPCILFFDSLKNASRGTQHDPKTVAKNLRNLLNFEWSRLGRAAESKCVDPFSVRCMLLVTPHVPQQQNGFDCGGFVCREAYGVYRLRHEVFSFGEANYDERNGSNKKKLFKSFLAEKLGFVRNKHVGDQNATDAAQRIRKEMMKLIEKLSTIYHKRKREENELKLLMIEKHDAGAAKVVRNMEIVHFVHSKNASNKVPPTHTAPCQADVFHRSAGSGRPQKLETQRVAMNIGLDKQQKKKKKKNVYLRDSANNEEKRSAKRGKRRHTRGHHLNHDVHPKKKNRFS